MACRAASRRSAATPWLTSWPIPFQSATTTPSKPHSLQHVPQQVPVRVHGDAVDVVEGGHDGAHARVDGCPERPQVEVAQRVLTDRDRVVVAPARREAVPGEVLGTGCDPVGMSWFGALEAPDHRGRHPAAEHRCLAERLRDPAPARLLGEVDHRGEGPRDTVDDGLACRSRRRARRGPRPRPRPTRAGSGRPCGGRGSRRGRRAAARPGGCSSTACRWAASMLNARTPSSRSLPPVAPLAKRLEPILAPRSASASSSG